MKRQIIQTIEQTVENAGRKVGPYTAWKRPLVGFAAADDPLFAELKRLVRPSHSLPGDLLPGARTVIAYFLPFNAAIARSNHQGQYASEEWAVAYIQTNRLIAAINDRIGRTLASQGFTGTRLPATHNFDTRQLMSDWSHKHVAWIAGIGAFGSHHMLITDQGCCGRLGSIVTDAATTPTPRENRERCLFKHDGSCGTCRERCPVDALGNDPFRRHGCYDRLLQNARRHEDLGLADVCGKCAAIVPCSFTDPVRSAARRRGGQP